MHDRIEHALHRWKQIRPGTGQPASQKAQEFAHWLERDVCPVVRELIERPDFQLLARWSLDNLLVNSETKARRLIERIDKALVDSANALASALENVRFPRRRNGGKRNGESPRLRRRQARKDHGDADDVLIGGSSSATKRGKQSQEAGTQTIQEIRSRVKSIGARPWNDLVSEMDYFGLFR